MLFLLEGRVIWSCVPGSLPVSLWRLCLHGVGDTSFIGPRERRLRLLRGFTRTGDLAPRKPAWLSGNRAVATAPRSGWRARSGTPRRDRVAGQREGVLGPRKPSCRWRSRGALRRTTETGRTRRPVSCRPLCCPPASGGVLRYPRRRLSTDWGALLAWASIEVPACCRIWNLVNWTISLAMSTSLIRLSEAVMFSS